MSDDTTPVAADDAVLDGLGDNLRRQAPHGDRFVHDAGLAPTNRPRS